MRAESRGSLPTSPRDRVTTLRDALTYEFVYTRHVASPPRLRLRADGDVPATSSFTIFQSTEAGVTRIFAVGAYEDIVTRTGPHC